MELTVHNVIIIMCIVDVDSFIHITDCNNIVMMNDDAKKESSIITHNTQSEYGFKYKGIFIVCSFCPHTQYIHVCKLVPTQTEFVRVLCTTSSPFPILQEKQHRASQLTARKRQERDKPS